MVMKRATQIAKIHKTKKTVKYAISKADVVLAKWDKYYNVAIWTDGNIASGYVYCGNGKFFTTLQESMNYIKKDKKERRKCYFRRRNHEYV